MPPNGVTGYGLVHAQIAHAIAIGVNGSVNPCQGPATCHARERTDIPPLADSPALAAAQIPGLHPDDLRAAYGVPSSGAGGTIAIVVAYHDPHAASDVNVYRAKFGLPPCNAGCLTIRSSDAANGPPPVDDGWTAETSIDLDMASAICPHCSLVLVEAKSDSARDMSAALDQALALSPAVISNSWSVPETLGAPLPAHPQTAVVAGTGDAGAGVVWPASDPSVIAVGGTHLVPSASPRGWSESAWGGSGYGCSAVFARPAWQAQTGCATRAVADVSAVADPATGVAIYDSVPQGVGPAATQGGWEVYGGTSVATPIVAAMIALAGNGPALANAQYLYAHAGALNAVQTGGNPLQAGLGSPNGLGAF